MKIPFQVIKNLTMYNSLIARIRRKYKTGTHNFGFHAKNLYLEDLRFGYGPKQSKHIMHVLQKFGLFMI